MVVPVPTHSSMDRLNIELPAWSKILDTKTGALRTVAELAAPAAPCPIVLNEQFENISSQTSCSIKKNGEKELLHVIAKGGRAVDVTQEDTLLTFNGWKAVKDLRPGDCIAVPNRLPFWGRHGISETDAKILAYMIGDGSCLNNRTRFTKDPDSMQVREMAELVQAYGCELHHYDSSARYNFDIRKLENLHNPVHLNGIKKMLTRYGLYGHKAAGKYIPQEIFMAPAETVSLFLSRLFATDGWASVSNSSGSVVAQIGYASNSEELIRGIAHLLLRFGISCAVREKIPGSWELSIASKKAITLFASSIGIYGKESNLGEVVRTVKTRADLDALLPLEANKLILDELTYQDVSIAEMESVLSSAIGRPQHLNLKKNRLQKNKAAIIADCLQIDKLKKTVKADLDWVEIKDIFPIGVHSIYVVNAVHNLVCNDILIGEKCDS